MPSQRYLHFVSGADRCAVALSSVREIARHVVLASVDGESGAGRINARGELAEVVVPGGTPIENPALCVVAAEETGRLLAFVVDQVLGVEEGHAEARLLVGPRPAA